MRLRKYKFKIGDVVEFKLQGIYVVGRIENRARSISFNSYEVILFRDKTLTWCLEDNIEYFSNKLRFNRHDTLL